MIEVIAPMPMRPHLYKYVCGVENLDDDQPLDITGLGIIPYGLQLVVERKPEWLMRSEVEHPETYTAILPVQMNRTRIYDFQVFFSSYASRQFDRFVHRLFHHSLQNAIIEGLLERRQERHVIRDFLEGYGITEDDISYASVKRAATKIRHDQGLPNWREIKHVAIHGSSFPTVE